MSTVTVTLSDTSERCDRQPVRGCLCQYTLRLQCAPTGSWLWRHVADSCLLWLWLRKRWGRLPITSCYYTWIAQHSYMHLCKCTNMFTPDATLAIAGYLWNWYSLFNGHQRQQKPPSSFSANKQQKTRLLQGVSANVKSLQLICLRENQKVYVLYLSYTAV